MMQLGQYMSIIDENSKKNKKLGLELRLIPEKLVLIRKNSNNKQFECFQLKTFLFC